MLKDDIERIESLGYKRSLFAEKRGSFIRLKNVDGHCIFLDPRTGSCRIYEKRPLGCRIYPLIYDEELGILLDPECPLASYWALQCNELEKGIHKLEQFLRALEIEYGYRVNWNLFTTSKRNLLSFCRAHKFQSLPTP